MQATLRIGNETRTLADANENWIGEQIRRRRTDGQDICIELAIQSERINVRLATPGCGTGGRGGRRANHYELNVIELWDGGKLNSREFSPDSVSSMIKRVRRALDT